MNEPDETPRVLGPAQRALVAASVPLAERLLGQFLRDTRAYYLADDLRSTAFEALHDTALAYDPTRGVEFPRYAWRRIDGALSDALGQESRHWRAAREDAYEAADALEDTSDPLADTDTETIAQIDRKADAVTAAPVLSLVGHALRAQGEEGELLRARYARIIQATEAALAALAEAERRILTAHYFEGREWRELGAELGWPERTAKRRAGEARTRFAAAVRAQREGAQAGAAGAGPAGASG